MMSLAISGQINLTSTLWFTGIWNILSGFMFQVPVCVQPMKGKSNRSRDLHKQTKLTESDIK